SDLVWCEGMSTWQSLDSVLAASGITLSSAASPPLVSALASGSRPKRRWVWILGVVGILLLAVILCLGIFTIRFVKRVREAATRVNEDSAVEVANNPVDLSTNALTEKDIRKRGKEFRVRQYLEGYKKYGRHDQPWDADALALIQGWIALHYDDSRDTNSPS